MEPRKIKISGSRPQGRITVITFMILLTMMAIIFATMISSYVLALATGAILALLTYPLFKKLTHFHIYPKIASGIMTVGIILLVVVPISALVFLAIQQGIAVAQSLAGQDGFSFQNLFDRVSHWLLIIRVFDSPDAAQQQVHDWVRGLGISATGAILNIAANIPRLLLQLTLAMISYFFFLTDGAKFLSWLADKIPLDLDVQRKVAASFENITITVIWATLAAAVAQTIIMFMSFTVLGIPAIFLATAATFIFAWIPVIGSSPVWIAGALYLYLQNSISKAILMIIFGLTISVVDNFVRPFVLKGKSNMHPLVSFVAILGGVGMFGIVGVFFGPIIAAVLIAFLQIWPIIGNRLGFISPESSLE